MNTLFPLQVYHKKFCCSLFFVGDKKKTASDPVTRMMELCFGHNLIQVLYL